jgi:hypothetical protein
LAKTKLKNVPTEHRYPHFQLKKTSIFWQIKGHNSGTEKVKGHNSGTEKVKGHNSGTEKVVKSKIQLVLPFMVPELVHKFQMLYLTGT